MPASETVLNPSISRGEALILTLRISPLPFFTEYTVRAASAMYSASYFGCSPNTSIRRFWPLSCRASTLPLLILALIRWYVWLIYSKFGIRNTDNRWYTNCPHKGEQRAQSDSHKLFLLEGVHRLLFLR
jgi:hypothetical protein